MHSASFVKETCGALDVCRPRGAKAPSDTQSLSSACASRRTISGGPHNVKLCRGRFHKMQVGGRAVPKGTTRRGRPPATLTRPSVTNCR